MFVSGLFVLLYNVYNSLKYRDIYWIQNKYMMSIIWHMKQYIYFETNLNTFLFLFLFFDFDIEIYVYNKNIDYLNTWYQIKFIYIDTRLFYISIILYDVLFQDKISKINKKYKQNLFVNISVFLIELTSIISLQCSFH